MAAAGAVSVGPSNQRIRCLRAFVDHGRKRGILSRSPKACNRDSPFNQPTQPRRIAVSAPAMAGLAAEKPKFLCWIVG